MNVKDVIEFGNLTYKVSETCTTKGYYLTNIGKGHGSNREIFDVLNIKDPEYYIETLGISCKEGLFPILETLKDLETVVNSLRKCHTVKLGIDESFNKSAINCANQEEWDFVRDYFKNEKIPYDKDCYLDAHDGLYISKNTTRKIYTFKEWCIFKKLEFKPSSIQDTFLDFDIWRGPSNQHYHVGIDPVSVEEKEEEDLPLFPVITKRY